MKTKISWIFTFIIFLGSDIYSQIMDSVQNIIEFSSDNLSASEERDESELADYLEGLHYNQLDINTASREELSVIPFLSPQESDKIIEFRKMSGRIFSKYELFMIRKIPDERIKQILPFIKTGSDSIIEQKKIDLTFRTRFRNKNLSAGKEMLYWNTYNYLRFELNNISAGFITEKDEGEKLITDHTSGYIHFKDIYSFSSFTIGDFLIENGQGLLFWGSYNAPKNAIVINSAIKKGRGIIPKNSRNESNYFRGIAAEKKAGSFKFTGFLSCRYLDASVDSSGKILKLIQDGYHRSDIELERKNSVSAKTAGGMVSFVNDNINIGTSFFATQFDKSFRNSKNIHGISLSISAYYRDISFFGESAFTGNSVSYISGIRVFTSDKVELITSIRSYAAGRINIYGSGFGEKNQNETGIYTGLRFILKPVELNIYFDRYKFPAVKGTDNNSLTGYDFLIDAVSLIKKNIRLNLRYKLDNKDELTNDNLQKVISKKIRQTIRGDLVLNYKTSSLKLRAEYLSCYIKDNINEKGIMVMQELKVKLQKNISLKGRIAFYRTDSFSSAIYLYESAIPGIIENTPLYSKGIRMFLAVNTPIIKNVSLNLKYSETIKEKPDVRSVPSIILQAEISY